ncbi:uncharacterized protein C2845_PM08G18510 [Panicum miliaceum]|uniref:Uncharacterized protein n=1 Tax=Panicum miliaceum TaxID=4540 RepID=A0A3L6R344_PANMI|nr:uncharacterized protein C2845_PM08G18510 [Panicum miliaceum]
MAAAATSSGGDVHIPIPSTAATTTPDAIRESSAASSPVRGDGASTPPRWLIKVPALPADATMAPPTAIDKTLASVANLAKLLPTGTVLAFQSLSPSFTNRGAFVGGDGKLYYGLATVKGFLVFNYTGDTGDDEEDAERRRQVFKNLCRLRIRNTAVRSCFFPSPATSWIRC